MNVLFLCLSKVWSITESGLYPDLLREFVKHDNNVYIVTPVERRYNENTWLIDQGKAKILKVKTLNIRNANLLEKGLGTILLEYQYLHAIKKYYKDICFDLVLYATPPITVTKPIKYIQKRNKAGTYLLLKDIFPQNALDYGMLSKTGPKGFIYRYFRNKERQLYRLSDHIGCTSQENIAYTLRNNPQLDSAKLELCVNSMEPTLFTPDKQRIRELRKKYDLPENKIIFLYGGNFGVPQGIDFVIQCLEKTKNLNDVMFLFIGSGTEENKLRDFIGDQHISNAEIRRFMPPEEFNELASACDVGMIFLSYRTTTPNTPSRLLAYTNASIPILAVTDPCTDVGDIIVDGHFGWKCLSNDCEKYYEIIEQIIRTENWDDLKENAHKYLLEHYTPGHTYESIMKHFG